MGIEKVTYFQAICDHCEKPALTDEYNEDRADLFENADAPMEWLRDSELVFGEGEGQEILCVSCAIERLKTSGQASTSEP